MTDTQQIRDLLATAVDQMPGGPVTAPTDLVGQRRPPRRRTPLVAAAFAIILLAVGLPTLLLHRPEPAEPRPPRYDVPTVTAYPTTGPATAESLAHGTWRRLPDAPIANREYTMSTWTGTQWLIWGGNTPQGTVADGAAYTPATRTWRMLPDSPLSDRAGAASVWTGSRWFLWGGSREGSDGVLSDGALYDPTTGRWQSITPSPTFARQGAVALWTGSEVVLIGGRERDPSGDSRGVAAYNPGTDTWRNLPDLPIDPNHKGPHLSAVAASDGIYVYAYWNRIEYNNSASGLEVMRYNPADDTWSPLATGAAWNLTIPLWTGKEILFPAGTVFANASGLDTNLFGWRLDPTTGAFQPIPHGPVDDLLGDSVWTGAALLTYNTMGHMGGPDGTVREPGQLAVWDPVTTWWRSLPAVPYDGPTISAWTGTELITWGEMFATGSTKPANVTLSFGR